MRFTDYPAFLLIVVFLLPGGAQAQKMEGMASFYADRFDGLKTSTGETFRQTGYMAASMDLPWGTIVEVTNLSNGKKTQVRINDCGPHAKGRIIDLSRRAAQDLDFIKDGETKVRLRVVRASESGPTCARGAWAKKLKAAGRPIPAKPGAWKPADTAHLTGEDAAPAADETVPVVTPAPPTQVRGQVGYYADNVAGRFTSTGERYEPSAYTAASAVHPYNTTLEVTNSASGQRVLVRVNDCVPEGTGRILDLSRAAADKIGLLRAGVLTAGIRIVTLGTDGPPCNREEWVEAIEDNSPRISGPAAAGTGQPPAPQPAFQLEPTVDAYRLQLGAFGKREAAETVRQSLLAKRYADALVVRDLNGRGLYYTILETPYTKPAATAVQSQLKEDGFARTILRKEQAPASTLAAAPASRTPDPANSVALAPPSGPSTYSVVSAPAPIAIGAPPSGQGTETAYSVQLGAFGSERAAYELYQKVAAAGYTDGYVYRNPETKLYTTALQSVYDKETAKAIKDMLAKDGFPTAVTKEVQAFAVAINHAPVSRAIPAEEAAPATYASPAPVATPAPERTFEPDAILFGVQIGAYSSAESVKKAKDQLTEEGVTEVYEAKSGRMTRVFAGKFYFQSQANELKEKLRRAGFPAATVRRVQ